MQLFNTPIRDLRRLFYAYFVSNLGTFSARLTMSVIVYELTGSKVSLAVSFIVVKLPIAIFGNALGVISGKLNQKKIMIFSDALGFLVFTLLAFCYQSIGPYWTLVGFFISYALVSLFDSAKAHMVSRLVTCTEEMNYAVATLTEIIYTTIAIGPLISGYLIEWTNSSYVLFLNAASFVVSILFLLSVRDLPSQAPVIQTVKSAFSLRKMWGLTDNLSTIAKNSILGQFSAFFFLRSITYGFVNALVPVIALSRLNIGSGGLGNYFFFICMGGIVGTQLYKRYWGNRIPIFGKGQIYYIAAASIIESSFLALCFGTTNVYIFYAASFLYGIPMLLVESRIDFIFLHYSPTDKKAAINGFQQVVKSVGFTVGILLSTLTVNMEMTVSSVLVAAGILLPLMVFMLQQSQMEGCHDR